MTGKRTLALAAVQFLWELARFLGLFALVLLRFQAVLREEPGAVLWLLALGSGQLLTPALLALFLYSPERRASLLPFLRLAKILQLFPVLLLAGALASRRGFSLLPFLSLRLTQAASLGAASLIDLAFLFLLFGLRPPSAGAAGAAPGIEPEAPPETPVGEP